MAKQSGSERAGAAGKRPVAAGKRGGRTGRKSGAAGKRPGGSTVPTIIVVMVVVSGIAALALSGGLRDLLTSGLKASTGSGVSDAVPAQAGDNVSAHAAGPSADVPADNTHDASAPSDAAAPVADADLPDDVVDRDDGHWRDRRRDSWQEPCWTTDNRSDRKPSPDNDARALIDLCTVDMPFPKSIGFDLKKSGSGAGTLPLQNGDWTCWENDDPTGDSWNCGGVDIADVAYVDFDRDQQQEAVIYFLSNFGGNCESYQVYAYDLVGKRPRFKATVADSDSFDCYERGIDRVEPFGQHCIKLQINCSKECHACEGTPCYDIFAWNGKTFEIAEHWLDWNDELKTPGSVETNPELLKLCGAD